MTEPGRQSSPGGCLPGAVLGASVSSHLIPAYQDWKASTAAARSQADE